MEQISTEAVAKGEVLVAAGQQYEFIKKIGAGAMGHVYLVRSPEREEPIALKFLPAGLTSEQRISGFKREFSLLSELHHPHVCRVYDFGFASTHRQCFFTAEFVEGNELFRAMLQAPMHDIELVIAQILSALDFIHTVGLIHFDIKGDNILVSRKSGQIHATLVDFGVTSPADKELTEIAGTLYYMAPELLQPRPQVDHRADLYSFGVACYRLLTGVYPYEVQSIDEARAFHQDPRIDMEELRRHGVPDYLTEMIRRLLATNPNDRFSSASVVLDFLSLHSGHEYKELPTMQRAKLIEGPLVGRDSMMSTITHALDRIVSYAAAEETMDQEEHSQAYLVSGGRGMGKSRILKEIKYTAQLDDCATWLVNCGQEGRELSPLLLALGHHTGDVAPPPDEAAKLLLESIKEQPTCFLFDNFDRGAPNVQKTILSLLGQLFSATLAHQAPPVIIVVTYTAGAGQAPQASGAPTLDLSPLKRDEVHSYLTQLVGEHEDIASFIDAVWDFSQGVPFLMVEAARTYREEAGALPNSIEELYAKALAELTPQARQLLECVSFSREPLTQSDLATLVGHAEDTDLQQLQSDGMIRYHPDDNTYSSATGALAQAVISGFDPTQRQILADQMLTWMEARPGFDILDAAEYAPFLTDQPRAIDILKQAASEAEKQGESERAVTYLQQCVDFMAHDPTHTEARIITQRKIATLLLYQGKYQACEELLHQIAAQQGQPDVEDLKMLGLAKRAQRKPKEAGPIYEQALQLLAKDISNPTYLFLLNERAQAYLEAGAVQQAVDIFQQSLTATRQLPKAKQSRVTNNNLGVALAHLGKFDEALAFYEEKLKTFAQEKRIAASIYGQMGVIYMTAGKTDDALGAYLQSWRKSAELGDQHNALALLDNIIALYQRRAAYSEALTYAQQSFQLKAAGGTDYDLARSLMTVATLYLNLGVPDLAARYLTQAMRVARKSRRYDILGWIHVTFGYLYKDLGRMMESLNAFEEAISIGENNDDNEIKQWGCYGAVDLLVDSGEIEESQQFLNQLNPLMQSVTDPEFQTRHTILLNKIEIMKHPRPADEIGPVLSKLSAQCETSGWGELQWEAEYLLGIYLQKRDERAEALEHLTRAAEIITHLAAGLGEEFRTNYAKQRQRAKVMADLKTLRRALGEDVSMTGVEAGTGTFAEAAGGLATAAPAAGEATVAGAPPAAMPTMLPIIQLEPGKTLAAYEKEIIATLLDHFANDHDETAQALGISISVLQQKMKEHGL